jgi:hypothetical protein
MKVTFVERVILESSEANASHEINTCYSKLAKMDQ